MLLLLGGGRSGGLKGAWFVKVCLGVIVRCCFFANVCFDGVLWMMVEEEDDCMYCGGK